LKELSKISEKRDILDKYQKEGQQGGHQVKRGTRGTAGHPVAGWKTPIGTQTDQAHNNNNK